MPKKKVVKGVVQQREEFIIGCKFIDRARRKYCDEFDSLGIDPAWNSFGWANKTEKRVYSGALVPEVGGFARALYIELRLKKGVIKDSKPFVGIEGYAHNATWGREMAGELGGVVRRLLFIKKRPLLVISPLTVKSWIKAKTKNQIMLEILDRYGEKISNEDAADAFVIADIIYRTLLMSCEVVKAGLSTAEEVRIFLKEAEYKNNYQLKDLFKYQADSLFNIIWKNGADCEFFLTVKEPLSK